MILRPRMDGALESMATLLPLTVASALVAGLSGFFASWAKAAVAAKSVQRARVVSLRMAGMIAQARDGYLVNGLRGGDGSVNGAGSDFSRRQRALAWLNTSSGAAAAN